jgi:cell division septal protein FtsQ
MIYPKNLLNILNLRSIKKLKKIVPKNYKKLIEINDFVRLKTIKCIYKIKLMIKYFLYFFFFLSNLLCVNAEIVKSISVNGNERISDETVIIFSKLILETI